MSRVLLGVLFFLASAGLIILSTFLGLDSDLGEIVVNLGTEIFGILVTIALVDWYLEKRRRQDRARELAWTVLHGIEHFVWVWQGGPRHLGTNELLGIIAGIREQNHLEPFTEGLIMNVGIQSRSLLQKEAPAVGSLPELKSILEDLVSLATLRDLPESTRIRTIAEILEASVAGLAKALGQSTDRMPSGLIWYRDPTPEGQEDRYKTAWPTRVFHPGPGMGPAGMSGAIPGGFPFPEPSSTD